MVLWLFHCPNALKFSDSLQNRNFDFVITFLMGYLTILHCFPHTFEQISCTVMIAKALLDNR